MLLPWAVRQSGTCPHKVGWSVPARDGPHCVAGVWHNNALQYRLDTVLVAAPCDVPWVCAGTRRVCHICQINLALSCVLGIAHSCSQAVACQVGWAHMAVALVVHALLESQHLLAFLRQVLFHNLYCPLMPAFTSIDSHAAGMAELCTG